MISLDTELAQEYLAECREHLATIETNLRAMAENGANTDGECLTRAFRAAHWIKGGAVLFGLVKVGELAQHAEAVLADIRCHALAPKPERVGVLRRATDKLYELVQNPGASNQADIAEIKAALIRLCPDHGTLVRNGSAHAVQPAHQDGRRLRMLLRSEYDSATQADLNEAAGATDALRRVSVRARR
jgi:chemotaxis protein histidine kinase CheA